MLAELSVSNLALIERLKISFDPGANVLTGETGAGKSIIVGALGLLSGRRAAPDLIRAGASEARVEALFLLEKPEVLAPVFESLGLNPVDEIVLRRLIAPGGRGRASLNGAMISQSQLAEIGSALLSITSQHDQQTLLKTANQLDYLDRFGTPPDDLAEMRRTWQTLDRAQTALRKLENEISEAREKRDVYEFQLSEIERLKPEPGEDESLLAEKAQAKNSRRLAEYLASASAALSEEPGHVLDKLSRIKSWLEKASEYTNDLDEAVNLVGDSFYQLSDAAAALAGLSQRGEDPERLDWVEERLNDLAKLKRKYGPTLDEVIVHSQKLSQRLDQLDGAGLELAELRRQFKKASLAAETAAEKLSRIRRQAAKTLSAKLTATLKPLGFPQLELEITFPASENSETPRMGPKGRDQVDILFSPNPGEGRRSLARIASGGELSRVMLALSVVQERSGDQLLVFDEIDTGLGGAAAAAAAAKMGELAGRSQLIIITHLPQMAALPGRHFVVAKTSGSERTSTTIEALTEQDRVGELSRMLGGQSPSPEARALAERLLSEY